MPDKSIEAIYDILLEIKADIGQLKALSHPPADCPLADRVRGLELKDAKQAGMLAVVGVVAGFVASSIVAVTTKLWK